MGNPYTEDTSPVRFQSGENQQPQTTLPVGTPPIGTDNAVTTTCGRSSCKGCPLWKAGKCPRVGSPPVLKADEVCHPPGASHAGAPPELHRDESNQPVPPLSSANATDNENHPDDPGSADHEIDFSPPGSSLTSKDDGSLASQSEIDFSGCSKDNLAGDLIARLFPKVFAAIDRLHAMTDEERERERVENEEAIGRTIKDWLSVKVIECKLVHLIQRLGGNSDE